LRHWWNTRATQPIRLTKVACVYLAFIHLVVAPLAWPLQSAVVTRIGRWGEQTYLNAPIDDTRVSQQDVFLLAAPDPMSLMYPPIIRRVNGRPMPRSWHCLSASGAEHIFRRTGANSFEFEASRGAIVHGVFADIVRDPSYPFAVGDTVQLSNARLTVLTVLEGKPSAIRVECTRPLDDPSLVFLQWKDYALHPFPIPPVGESRSVRSFTE
jgi:hypothetical protein